MGKYKDGCFYWVQFMEHEWTIAEYNKSNDWFWLIGSEEPEKESKYLLIKDEIKPPEGGVIAPKQKPKPTSLKGRSN